MVTQVKNPVAIFPDLPRATPTVDKEGNFNPEWNLGLSSLFQALQQNYKNEGILFPSLNQTQANAIQAIYTPLIGVLVPPGIPPGIPNISGQTIYNTTIAMPQIFIINFDGATPPNITGARWWTFTIT
jgi:hypothetical protein